MVDISQEEMRYLLYEKKKLHMEEEYITFEKNLKKAYSDMRNVLEPGLGKSVCSSYQHVPLEYFNSIVEEKEESVNLGALGCKIYKEAAEKHFSLTNCKHCQEKIKEKKN